MDRKGRTEALKEAFSRRILVKDGAMGTSIHAADLSADDFGGTRYEGCNEQLCMTRPDLVGGIHRSFLAAGADIILTNTFGATSLVLSEYGLSDSTAKINLCAAQIARQAADEFSTPDRPRFVAGSMGPTTKSITVTGGVTFDDLVREYAEQAGALLGGGVDFLLFETCQDTLNVKAGLCAVGSLFESGSESIPVALSCTIEPNGTMLAGQNVEAFWASVAHHDLLYLGLNCATGPEFMTDHLRSLDGISTFPLGCAPNAGMPDENGRFPETPQSLSEVLGRFVDAGFVNLIGGCCGTTPAHIAALSDLVRGVRPAARAKPPRTFLCGIDFLEMDSDRRPVLVGERTNIVGSRKFRDAVRRGDFSAATDIARAQIRGGAQILDLCFSDPMHDEWQDMLRFLRSAGPSLKTPIMIDSTNPSVVELALRHSQGKAIINSVNLENGEDRLSQVVALARRYGAALVVGTIDEDPHDGMAVRCERKLAVARRSYKLLTESYAVAPQDIYFDALVFPCATGDSKYVGSAVETIAAVRALKKEFQRAKTVLGISNVSFGLPQRGRRVLNSVFLYHAVEAGLDLAIVNTEVLDRYPSIPENERLLAEDLLWNRGADPCGAFVAHFREKSGTPAAAKARLPLDERLAAAVITGSKEGLIGDLDEALADRDALSVINGPLLAGMDEVGRLFRERKLIVAEVLQSAEVMKAAVDHLDPHLRKVSAPPKAKLLLATVKGDVHDIGKNLVEIIFAANGFQVLDLGIKVPPERLIEACAEHSPDLIGLSGLLVKSAHQMTATAQDLARVGIRVPILAGGAALTKAFVDRDISPAYAPGIAAYASDAMSGLETARRILEGTGSEEVSDRRGVRKRVEKDSSSGSLGVHAAPSSVEAPQPPDFDRHVLTDTPLEEIWKLLNPKMLLGRHLGLPNSLVKLIETRDSARLVHEKGGDKALALDAAVDGVKQMCRTEGLLLPRAVYRFVRAARRGNGISLLDPLSGAFEFPRMKQEPFLCLSDYLCEDSDVMCLFVVTSGFGVRGRAEELKSRGEFLRSHILSALALETAEAYAEWLHAEIRRLWGFPDPPGSNAMDLYQGKYRGRRYSFGYGACPDLAGQKLLFDILRPEETGVTLTETFMMDPEAGVSAIVIHHPQARYFKA